VFDLQFDVASANEEDYGLIRPSLIKQLRSILDQYPDNGQILKVCMFSNNGR